MKVEPGANASILRLSFAAAVMTGFSWSGVRGRKAENVEIAKHRNRFSHLIVDFPAIFARANMDS
jgi:hypothetical protein